MAVQTGLTHHVSGVPRFTASAQPDEPSPTKKIDTSRLHARAVELVELAEQLGWRGRTHDNGGVVLITADEVTPSQRVEIVPVRQWNEAKLKTIRRKIIRHGVPDKVAEYLKSEKKSTPPPATAPEQKSLVSSGPWMASPGGSQDEKVPSRAVIERKWSDGTSDYGCAVPGCIYSHPKPYGVVGHYGRTNRPDHVEHRAKVGTVRDDRAALRAAKAKPVPAPSVIDVNLPEPEVVAPPEPEVVSLPEPDSDVLQQAVDVMRTNPLTLDEGRAAINDVITRITAGQQARIVELEAILVAKEAELVDVSERLKTLKDLIQDA